MSNELNNIIARNTDGVYEGVAIGGDRYPGTTFMDHLLRYQVFVQYFHFISVTRIFSYFMKNIVD
jgi:hypothetical protein